MYNVSKNNLIELEIKFSPENLFKSSKSMQSVKSYAPITEAI